METTAPTALKAADLTGPATAVLAIQQGRASAYEPAPKQPGKCQNEYGPCQAPTAAARPA